MRVDPGTGALDSGAGWRVEPREPQSSFVRWAGSVGFGRGLAAEVGEWVVVVRFRRSGTLAGVRLSTASFERLEAWAEQQPWPVGVFWDKFFSDAYAMVEYPADAVSDGPMPSPGDLALLARAPVLTFGPVDDDLTLTPEYLAFERLSRRPPSVDELAEVVRGGGTAAGRLYAAWLLSGEDRRAAFEALADDTSPLSTGGPLTTVGEYARGVASAT